MPGNAASAGQSIIVSGFVSLTLTPMLCSLFLKKPHHHGGASKFGQITEQGFDRMLKGYDRTLQIVLKHRPATMLFSGVVLALTALPAGYRMLIGPTRADRVSAADAILFILVGLIALIGWKKGSHFTFDIVLVATVVGFLSAVSLARALMRGER